MSYCFFQNEQVALPLQKELETSPAKMPRLTPEKSENDQKLSNSKPKAKVNLIEKVPNEIFEKW